MKPLWPSHYTPPSRKVMPAVDLRDYIARSRLVAPEAMMGTDRSSLATGARAVFIGVLRARGHSTGTIGRLVQRDHTTVLHALKKLPAYLKRSPGLAHLYADLMAKESV